MKTLRRIKIDLAPAIEEGGGGPGRLFWHQEYGMFVWSPNDATRSVIEIVPPPFEGNETQVRIEGSYWAFRGEGVPK